MKWGSFWPECALLVAVLAVNGFRWFHSTNALSPVSGVKTWTPERKLTAREKTRQLWYHGFDNYMEFAFPMDELTPLTCAGQGPDWSNPANIASNDVAGNFSLTLIDVLDTLVVLDDRAGFDRAVRDVIKSVSFDVDTRPQVFETTIRVLGGLLSGHIFANKKGQPFYLPWYSGELLKLAHDLGERLLPAFNTPTGLPYARVNLRRGVLKGETVETCTAGAGSLILEFATLSRLTGDERFEKAAHKAFFGLWNRKSDINLVGNTINTRTGAWTHPETTSIGAGIDSFYEYALKWYILSGDIEFLDVWDDAYAAVMRYNRQKDGYWYKTVNIHSGEAAYTTIDSLSAFWPGLQVLAGDVENAIKLHMIYWNLWKQHSGLPEVYDTQVKRATSHQYPLRPEFIESTWYLYRATRDPFYLDVGERVLFDLTTRAKVDCGLTGISDLRDNKRDDRMESFALSETLKYLFLLFDEDNPLHSDDSNYVFTTEGHILSLDHTNLKPTSHARRKMRTVETHQCPAFSPFSSITTNSGRRPGLVQGVRSRHDVEYTQYLVGRASTTSDEAIWDLNGWCERPKADPYIFDFILSPNGQQLPEDLSPSFLKIEVVHDGYVLHNISGVRAQIVQRLDGKGYDVRRLGHYVVRAGQSVYINDSSIFQDKQESQNIAQEPTSKRDVQVQLQLFTIPNTNNEVVSNTFKNFEFTIKGYSAVFGADLSVVPKNQTKSTPPLRQSGGVSLKKVYSANKHGCDDYIESYDGAMVVVNRGSCTFFEKAVAAKAAGAVGILILNHEDTGINPSLGKEELETAEDLNDFGVVLVPKKLGDTLEDIIKLAEKLSVDVLVRVPPPIRMEDKKQVKEEETDDDDDDDEPNSNPSKILYINGYPLINTRLLV